MQVARIIGIRDRTRLDGWEIIVNDNGGFLHVQFKPPSSDRYPNWIRVASIESPLEAVAKKSVPTHVQEHGMARLRSAEMRERANPERLVPKTPAAQLDRDIAKSLATHRRRPSKRKARLTAR